ncbi:MAG: hypothetical protein ACRDAM_21030, partial [Casimicrobium sp.]
MQTRTEASSTVPGSQLRALEALCRLVAAWAANESVPTPNDRDMVAIRSVAGAHGLEPLLFKILEPT